MTKKKKKSAKPSRKKRVTKAHRDGPTPNGGVRSIMYYQDDKGRPADRDKATAAEIVELNKEGKVIHRTYGFINRKVKNA